MKRPERDPLVKSLEPLRIVDYAKRGPVRHAVDTKRHANLVNENIRARERRYLGSGGVDTSKMSARDLEAFWERHGNNS